MPVPGGFAHQHFFGAARASSAARALPSSRALRPPPEMRSVLILGIADIFRAGNARKIESGMFFAFHNVPRQHDRQQVWAVSRAV